MDEPQWGIPKAWFSKLTFLIWMGKVPHSDRWVLLEICVNCLISIIYKLAILILEMPWSYIEFDPPYT